MPQDVLNGVQTVVFDLDGTLYDKHGLAHRMVRRLWWCLPLMAVDRLACGRCWRWIVATRWHRRIYLPTMVELIRTTCPLRPEAMALLKEAKTRGLTLAVYSDYGCIKEKLQALHIDPNQFDLLIDAPSLGARKPSEQAARQVMSRLKAVPSSTLFVGDREDTDVASAKCVGARFHLVGK